MQGGEKRLFDVTACGQKCVINSERRPRETKATKQDANIPEQTCSHCAFSGVSAGRGVVSDSSDLPSQLLQELSVVRREELHHKPEDGVFRPCRREKTE